MLFPKHLGMIAQRGGCFEALNAEPQAADQALKMIGLVYEVEAVIRGKSLPASCKA